MKKSILSDATGKSFLIPFILVSTLYLLWGCAHGLLDVLNKHFRGAFEMSKAGSGFVQFSTYIAYFIMAIPAGMLIRKIGYKKKGSLQDCYSSPEEPLPFFRQPTSTLPSPSL